MKKKKIETLLSTMYMIENENIINKLKRIGKNEKKEILTKVGVLCTPVAIFSLISIATNNPMFLTGIAYSAAGIGLYTVGKDFIKDMKEMKRIYNNPGIMNTTVTKPKKQKEKTIKEKEQDYYTKEYSKMIEECNKTNKNTKEVIKPSIEIEIDDNKLSDTCDIITSLKKELDAYYTMYELPPFIVKDEELEIIIDILKNTYENKDVEVYNVISDIIKTTFADTMISGKDAISVEEIYESLKYLKYYKLTEIEIKLLSNKIKQRVNEYKDERFNSFMKKVKL